MSFLESLDSSIVGFLSQWNAYSTGLVTLLVLLTTLHILSTRDADVHPLLLARQSMAADVRNKGESAIYRALNAPHSMPLNSGLNVKDPGASKWARGRDGDIRDVWRQFTTSSDGKVSRLLTVLGSENVVEHDLDDVTRQINLIGQHIADQGGIRVAIYLPNCLEFLVTLFACSFQKNLTTVLIPFDVADDELISMLRRAAVDTVVTATGSFPFDTVVRSYPALRQLVWVVDEGSAHLDWNEVPQGTGSIVSVSTWQEIIKDAPASSGAEIPAVDTLTTPQDVITFWPANESKTEEMVRFTQANLVSGIAGQLTAVPTREKLDRSDLLLPADSLTNIHALTVTLSAMYQNVSVALNSVAGRSYDLTLSTQGIAPSVLIASPGALLKIHQQYMTKLGALGRASHHFTSRSLVRQGVFSKKNFLSSFATAAQPAIGNVPGKLRLIYTADRAGAHTPHLSSQVLSDLRVLTGARIIYALSAARVAGAVTQTAFYDYRAEPNAKSHFGPPLTCTEIYMKDLGTLKTTDEKVEGEICVRGPAVSGGEAGLGLGGRLRDDNTLTYI